MIGLTLALAKTLLLVYNRQEVYFCCPKCKAIFVRIHRRSGCTFDLGDVEAMHSFRISPTFDKKSFDHNDVPVMNNINNAQYNTFLKFLVSSSYLKNEISKMKVVKLITLSHPVAPFYQ